ncbi:peptidylprolyl isomerase [Altericroceibacterium endophyticum]|uniref:Peptidylprolyl isomerase n=1 Tax=Altericroceibacterium endophyticum TaxID=1808508 RepID=A0A6I4T6V1_9SPHN|nr:peptidylprolyl isomerase [Altericroceibacterium endophyticum]MXO66666.1 peptidylprolyl isomerase [Altericroceibacterium endophyticum]
MSISPRAALARFAFSCALTLSMTVPVLAEEPGLPTTPEAVRDAAPEADWAPIAAEDLLVMTLAPADDGAQRRVIIQLLPDPVSAGWVSNIRLLANAQWWDGTSVYRVVDNWVAQWGDGDETKPLPGGIKTIPESAYTVPQADQAMPEPCSADGSDANNLCDTYAPRGFFRQGWPMASDGEREWPVHCYASVGVARDLSPNTGSGSELYAVIGQAPRQLDRNIAVVGRVIDGIEHLTTLPRGEGPAGVYADTNRRTPIQSVRLASSLPAAEQPLFEYLRSDSDSFARYLYLRANRQDSFYQQPAGGVDLCNVGVPVREAG